MAQPVHQMMHELGLNYQEDGHHMRALSHFLAAAALAPEMARYTLCAANAHLKLGEVDSARALYATLDAAALPAELVAEYEREAADAQAAEVRSWRVGPAGWERIRDRPRRESTLPVTPEVSSLSIAPPVSRGATDEAVVPVSRSSTDDVRESDASSVTWRS